jgi:hypothetical protein
LQESFGAETMGIEIEMPGNGGSAEHRSAKRFRLRGEATARALESDISLPGRVLDLSARGCLLVVPSLAPFAVDTLVDLSIRAANVNFRAVGSVRHHVPNHWRLGISFVNLSRRGQAELVELLEALELAEKQGRADGCEIRVMQISEPGDNRRLPVPPPSPE